MRLAARLKAAPFQNKLKSHFFRSVLGADGWDAVDYFTAEGRDRARRESVRGILRVRHRGEQQNHPAVKLSWEQETFQCSEGDGQERSCNWSTGYRFLLRARTGRAWLPFWSRGHRDS